MNLESAVKYFSPKSLSITTESPCTAGDRLTATDIMAALGMSQSQSKFGMALFFAKVDLSEEAKMIAIEELEKYAHTQARKYIGKTLEGRQLARAIKVLANYAFNEYTNSADANVTCKVCDGQKKINGKTCLRCRGTGLTKNRCRCNGTGKVVDRLATEHRGVLIHRDCSKCKGKGYSRIPSSVPYRVINNMLPELHERTWRRNWKPFLEHLITKCQIEESFADDSLKKVTK